MEKGKDMESLFKLERIINRIGWYGGTHKLLNIYIEGGFEAFSGRASETWEYRVVIELNELLGDEGQILLPNIKEVGSRWESIEEVAKKVLNKINQ